MKTLSIDIETYSDVPLQKSGVYRYCESPNFEILLFGYSADSGPVQVVDLACGEKIPADVLNALTDDTVTKWAFNASFERVCLSRYLRDLGISLDPFHDKHPLSQEMAPFLNPESWRCSMVWAATMGLPLSLEGVGAVLGLEKQKLTEGKELIKFFCQPCAPTKANGQRTRNRPFHAPDKWDAFKRYNMRDVETEMGIQQRLAKFPVPDQVWEEYHIDQEINDRGVRLDMELVHAAIDMDTRSRQELTTAMKRMTSLENPNSVQQMKVIELEYQIPVPTCVQDAISEYRSQNDWFGHFIEDKCDTGDDYKESSSSLYQAYRNYCIDTNEYVRSTADFYFALESAGFERVVLNRKRYFKGLRIRTEDDAGDDFLK